MMDAALESGWQASAEAKTCCWIRTDP